MKPTDDELRDAAIRAAVRALPDASPEEIKAYLDHLSPVPVTVEQIAAAQKRRKKGKAR